MKHLLSFFFFLAVLTTASLAFELHWPLDCQIGQNCWVQQYVDHDAGPGHTDYRCGGQSYDGHDGTDFRLRDTASRADVLVAAAGVVKSVRDGMADRLIRNEADRAAVKDRECGNGVVIAHADGYETQYCHMRNGSIAVKAGDELAGGTRLGEVGYSGAAAFPHLHLSLRKDGQTLDPFSGSGSAACDLEDQSLWAKTPGYEPGAILRMGWSDSRVAIAGLEIGAPPERQPSPTWPALVAYAWLINLQKGDLVTIAIGGPNNLSVANAITADNNKAHLSIFSGRPLKAARWPSGIYVIQLRVKRGTTIVLERQMLANMP